MNYFSGRKTALVNILSPRPTSAGDNLQKLTLNAFEWRNRTYELTTQVNALSIEKEQIIRSYQNALEEERARGYRLANINEVLVVEKRELNQNNEKLEATLSEIAAENKNLTIEINWLKNKFQDWIGEERSFGQFKSGRVSDFMKISSSFLREQQESTAGNQSNHSQYINHTFAGTSYLYHTIKDLETRLHTKEKTETQFKVKYEAVVAELQKQAIHFSEQQTKVLVSNEKLKKEIEDMKRVNGELKLQLEMQDTRSEIQKWKTRTQYLEDELRKKDMSLKQQIKEQWNENQKVRREVNQLQEQIFILPESLREAEERRKPIQSPFRLKQEHASLSEQGEADSYRWGLRVSSFNRQGEWVKSNESQLRLQLELNEAEIKQLTQKLWLQLQTISSHAEQIQHFNGQLRESKRKLEELQKANHQLLVNITQSEQKIVQLNKEIQILIVCNARECEQLERIKLQKGIQEEEYLKQVSKLREEIESREEKIKEIEQGGKSEKDELRLLKSQYEDLESKQREGEEDLRAKIKELDTALEDQKKEKEMKIIEEQSLKKEIERLKEENLKAQREYCKEKGQRASDLRKIEENIEKLTEEIGNISREKDILERSYKSRIKEKKEQIAELESRYEQLEVLEGTKMFQLAQEENSKLKDSYTDALVELNVTLQRCKNLEEICRTQTDQTLLMQDFYKKACLEKDQVLSELEVSYAHIDRLKQVLLFYGIAIPSFQSTIHQNSVSPILIENTNRLNLSKDKPFANRNEKIL